MSYLFTVFGASPWELYDLVTRKARVPAVVLAPFKVGRPICSYFEKGCRKKCARDNPDMFNTLFLTLWLSNLLLLLSFSTRRHMSMASPAILSNFFEKQWTQNHPQYLSGLSRALYPTTFLEIAVYLYTSRWYPPWRHLVQVIKKNYY